MIYNIVNNTCQIIIQVNNYASWGNICCYLQNIKKTSSVKKKKNLPTFSCN